MVATEATPVGVLVSPDGNSAYVPNFEEFAVFRRISQYNVGADGTLSPKLPATVGAGEQPAELVMTPNGDSLYAPNTSSDDLSQYDVGSDGRLSRKTPATVGAGSEPTSAAISPDGNNLYVGNMAANTVSQYDVASGGALSPKSTATVPTGETPVAVAVSPDTTPPELSLSANSQPVRKFVRVRAECENEDCEAIPNGRLRIRLTDTARTAKVKPSRRLRETTAELQAGEGSTLKLRTKARGRRAAKRALRRGHRVSARVRVKAIDLAGNRTTVRIKIRLS